MKVKEAFWVKQRRESIERNRATIERLRSVIADHEAALAGVLSIGRRHHEMTSLQFRQLDIANAEKKIAIYEAIDSLESYRESMYKIEEIDHDIPATSKIFYDGYIWQAEQYEAINSPGNAARCRKDAAHFREDAERFCLEMGINPT